MNNPFVRWAIRCSSIVTSLFLFACVSQQGMKTTSSTRTTTVMTVKWQPPCAMDSAETYFSMDILDDGIVRYLGGEQAREVGERTEHISRREVRELQRLARDFVRSDKRSSKGTQPHEYDSGDEYCLGVIVYSHAGASDVRRFSSDARQTKAIVSALEKIVNTRRWVCPARYSERSRDSSLAAGFCGGWLERKIIGFSVRDRTGCISHDIRVFKDVLHYVVTQTSTQDGRASASRVVVEERYYNITEEDALSSLVASVRRMHIAHALIEEPNPRPDLDYFGSDQQDVLQLKAEISRLFAIRWHEMPPGSEACSEYGDQGSIRLRYEFGLGRG